MLQDLCNCYMYLFATPENLKDYEEKLLEKCFDNTYDIAIGHTQAYEPPFCMADTL